MSRIIVAALALLLASTASAQEPAPLSCRWYANDGYWGTRYSPPHCWRHKRWPSAHRRLPHRHGYVPPPAHDGAACHPLLAATGEQAQSKENAETKALTAWQGRVRFHYGERFIDIANAKDPRVACSPSSVADTVGGKIQDKLLGVSHYRCEIAARPCRAEPKRMRRDRDDE
mgnify:FL=1